MKPSEVGPSAGPSNAQTVDERRSLERMNTSIDSDVSNHEFTLEIKERSPRQSEAPVTTARSSGSPFAHDNLQAIPIPRGIVEKARRSISRTMHRPLSSPMPSMPSLDETRPQLDAESPHTRMDNFKSYRQQLGTRGAFSLELPGMTSDQLRDGMRVSVDMPRQTSAGIDPGIEPPLVARLIRKRRRLPMGVVIGFGVVSSVCLCVAITTLGIGLFNFTKLRANRAAKSIDQLEADLLPYLASLRDTVSAAQLGVATLLNRTGG